MLFSDVHVASSDSLDIDIKQEMLIGLFCVLDWLLVSRRTVENQKRPRKMASKYFDHFSLGKTEAADIFIG